MVNAVEKNETIHDFSGFPEALYRLSYPAAGSAELAERVVDLLGDAGLSAATNTSRGLDHGAWVPLMLIWPDADIPVVQLSVQSQLGPGHHLEVGRAIAPLTRQGVLIIASGSYTHDLSSWRGQQGVALGAAGSEASAERLHTSNTYGVLRMDAYAFGGHADQLTIEGTTS